MFPDRVEKWRFPHFRHEHKEPETMPENQTSCPTCKFFSSFWLWIYVNAIVHLQILGFFFPKFLKSLTVRVQVMASKNDLFSIIYIRNLLLQWKSFIASRNSSVIHMQGKLMKNRPVIRKISYPMWFLHIVLLAVVLPRRDSNRYSSWYWYLETRLIAKTFSISGVPVSPAVLIYRVIRRVFYKYVLPCLFI